MQRRNIGDDDPGVHVLVEIIRKALTDHGKESKDFRIAGIPERSKSIEVLVRHLEFVSPSLTLALDNVLDQVADDHEVLLILADPEWRPVLPKSGFRVALGQLDTIPPAPAPEISEYAAQRTEALRAALSQVLSRLGRENWRGEGDYWIFDDWIGPYSQKVYVWNIEFITPNLIQTIRQALEDFTDCEVILALDEATPHPPSGLRLSARKVEEEWNRPALRNLFGSRLRY